MSSDSEKLSLKNFGWIQSLKSNLIRTRVKSLYSMKKRRVMLKGFRFSKTRFCNLISSALSFFSVSLSLNRNSESILYLKRREVLNAWSKIILLKFQRLGMPIGCVWVSVKSCTSTRLQLASVRNDLESYAHRLQEAENEFVRILCATDFSLEKGIPGEHEKNDCWESNQRE